MSDLVFAVWLLLVGAVGGSAMAALADRLETGRSWLTGRSACATCGQPIASEDLVPVVSYLRLGGRCRACDVTLPRRLLLAEIAGVGCAALALVVAQGAVAQFSGAVFLLVLLGLFLTDLQTMRLPNILTSALALAGLSVGVPFHGLLPSLAAAAIGVAALLTLAAGYQRLRGRPGLGRGDIKMMAGLSAMAGPVGLPWVTLIAAVLALGVAALRPGTVRTSGALPFGCYLAISGAVVFALISAGLL